MLKNNPTKSIIAIELTSHCNLTCLHCPQGKVKVTNGHMEKDIFLKCLKYANGYTELNWRGEATLHPNFLEFVKIAKEFNNSLDLGFHTNGMLMDKQLFRNLSETGIDWIHVSLHTLESCEKFLEMKEWNEMYGGKINIYAEVDNTQEELMALSMGIADFQFNTIMNWAGYLTDYRQTNSDVEETARNCLFPKENKFAVSWDGVINACCLDFEQLHSLGHIDDFESIQHNPPYKLCPSCIWIRDNRNANRVNNEPKPTSKV